MRTLGIYSSGGNREQTRLRNQMKRLFHCTYLAALRGRARRSQRERRVIARPHRVLVERAQARPALTLGEQDRLGEDFFNEIINHPVPIDMNTLKALKRCSLGLDLYLWLVYRTFPLRAPLRLTWRQVYRQFGLHPDKASDKKTVQNFRRQGSARVAEDQAGLEGLELLNGSGPSDPASLNSQDRADQSGPAN